MLCENYTNHIKNKVIDFAPTNKPIMANKLPSTNLGFSKTDEISADALRKKVTGGISFQIEAQDNNNF